MRLTEEQYQALLQRQTANCGVVDVHLDGSPLMLVISEATPSLNEMLRRHWSVDRKLKQRWRTLVGAAIVRAGRTLGPLVRARVTVTRLSPRMLDPDNATGGAKHVIDALRACHVIADDTPEHIELIVRQEKGKAATHIQIEALT